MLLRLANKVIIHFSAANRPLEMPLSSALLTDATATNKQENNFVN